MSDTDNIDAMRQALAKANDEAKTFRLERNELKTQVEQLTAQVAELELTKAESDSKAARAQIEHKLEQAGLPTKFAEYMTLDDVDEQISELKQSIDFNTDAADKPAAAKAKSSAQKLLDNFNQ